MVNVNLIDIITCNTRISYYITHLLDRSINVRVQFVCQEGDVIVQFHAVTRLKGEVVGSSLNTHIFII